jgi:signal transduction histidine kinase
MARGAPAGYGAPVRRLLDMPQPWLEPALALVMTVGVELELAAHGLLDTPAQGIAAAFVAAPLAVRFRWPLATLAAVLGGWIAATALGVQSGDPILPVVCGVLAIYAVGSRSESWRFWAGAALAIAGMATQLLLREPVGPDLALAVALPAAALLIGRALGVLEFESDVLERERDERIAEALAAERGRIARELHDVVGHSISVMGIQAGAVRRLLAEDQVRERDALLAVERTGRQAVGEMRRLIGLLRPGPDEIASPSPSLRRVEQLVAETRDAGVSIDLHVTGALDALPAGVDLAGYRIVQESLTNTLKHAPGSHVSVDIRAAREQLEIEVRDDGGPVSGAPSANGRVGHGLIGMSERVSLYGGTLTTGVATGGGFRVHARIPLEEG